MAVAAVDVAQGGLCLLDYSFNSEAFSDLKVSEACARWIIPSIQNLFQI